MKTTWAKLACSSLALGTLAIGCTPTAGLHPSMLATSGPKATKLAARSDAKAQKLLAAHQPFKAIGPAEIAVATAPSNAAYRSVLGQAYLQSGRFASASTALAEALNLDPTNAKAGLNLSLAQSALGRHDAALATLAQVRDGIATPDLGLALVLAGAHDDAINLLANEARTHAANPKVRQNLAFALAMAGRWTEARAVARQDLSPNDLDARMRDWALLSLPKSSADQVASVLGVHPVADPGEPSMLALAQPASPVAVAAAAPVPMTAPVPVAPVTASAPVVVAAAPAHPIVAAPAAPEAPASALTPVAAAPAAVADAAAPSTSPPVRFFYPGEEATNFGGATAADDSSVTSSPAAREDYSPVKPVAAVKRGVPKLLARKAPSAMWPKVQGGEFVVQLGAFSRPERVQAAWSTASDHYLRQAAFMPSSMTFSGTRQGRLLYRLSIAGFKSHDDAQLVCDRIRAGHGKCFVRAAQGDQIAAWFKQGTAVASRGPAPKPLKPGQDVRISLATLPLMPAEKPLPKKDQVASR